MANGKIKVEMAIEAHTLALYERLDDDIRRGLYTEDEVDEVLDDFFPDLLDGWNEWKEEG